MGSEASVPVLAGMLADPKTADMARYALERIPGAAVDRALRDALAKTPAKTRIGIDQHDRRRAAMRGRSPRCVRWRWVPQADEASAALFALAKIADAAAVAVLDEAQTKTTGACMPMPRKPYLQSANRLAERGNTAAALPIYRKLYAATDPGTVRAAALRGLAMTGGAQSRPVLMEAVRGSDLRLQAIAVNALMPSSAAQLIDGNAEAERSGAGAHPRACSPNAPMRRHCPHSRPR